MSGVMHAGPVRTPAKERAVCLGGCLTHVCTSPSQVSPKICGLNPVPCVLEITSIATLSKGKWSERLQLMLGFKDLFIKLEMLYIYSLILPFSEFTLTMVCLASSATEKDQEHFSQPSRCIMQTASDTCCPGNWSFKTHINRVLMAEL